MSESFVGIIIGFASAYIGLRKNGDNNSLKYITEERQKWRVSIRNLSILFLETGLNEKDYNNLNNKKLRIIREKIAVRLNPNDKKDNYILELMDLYIGSNCIYTRSKIHKILSNAFAVLLKHDWERAKKEANSKFKISSSSIIFYICFIAIIISFLKEGNISIVEKKIFIDVELMSLSIFLILIVLTNQLVKYLYCLFKENFNVIIERESCFSKCLGIIVRKDIDSGYKK